MSSNETPRRAARKAVTLPALCRVGSLRDEGFISDISPGGCCITTKRLMVSIGSRVTVKPKGLEGITGVVRWIRGRQVGVQFDTALYEPVIEHLGQLHAAGETVSLSSL
jgi:hypothetical protein